MKRLVFTLALAAAAHGAETHDEQVQRAAIEAVSACMDNPNWRGVGLAEVAERCTDVGALRERIRQHADDVPGEVTTRECIMGGEPESVEDWRELVLDCTEQDAQQRSSK